MRVSNNIHNVACLDEVEFIQEWTEEEKIPIKSGGTTGPTKAPEAPKESEAPKEGEEAKAEAPKEGEEAKAEAPTVPEPPKPVEQ